VKKVIETVPMNTWTTVYYNNALSIPVKYYTRNEWRRFKTTPETSGEDAKLHPKRVEKMQNYTQNEWRSFDNHTRNEWRTCENYTRNEWRRCKTTPKTSGEVVKLHPKRVEKF
jgi:hypothetical protein